MEHCDQQYPKKAELYNQISHVILKIVKEVKHLHSLRKKEIVKTA